MAKDKSPISDLFYLNQIEMKKWAELTVTSTEVLVGCISACHGIQVKSPASGSVHLQN